MRRSARGWRLTVGSLSALAVALAVGAAPAVSADSEVVLVDSLGEVSMTQTFAFEGSGGYVVGSGQMVGPRFVLTSPMVITEAGAFINTVPILSRPNPFVVRFVRADATGVPGDPYGPLGLGSFDVPDDGDPQIVSYEAAHPGLSLGPGTYYALFDSQNGARGYLLMDAASPFPYLAGPADLGFWSPPFSVSWAPNQPTAVRVVAIPGTGIHRIVLTYVAENGGPTVKWEGDVVGGAFLNGDGDVTVDSTFGEVHVTADLRSRHVARLMTGSLTASRGSSRITFRNVNAPFAKTSDGALVAVSPIRASFFDGRSTTFGQVTLRFELGD